MKFFSKRITAAVAAVALLSVTACSGFTSTTNAIAALMNSQVGQSFIQALGVAGNLIPGVQQVLTDLDNGVATAAPALQTVCFALPWADGAVDFFGPSAGVNATTIGEIDAAVKAFVAGPCANPPTTLAQAVSEGASLFMTIMNDLHGAGVPVVTPASTTVAPARLQ